MPVLLVMIFFRLLNSQVKAAEKGLLLQEGWAVPQIYREKLAHPGRERIRQDLRQEPDEVAGPSDVDGS